MNRRNFLSLLAGATAFAATPAAARRYFIIGQPERRFTEPRYFRIEYKFNDHDGYPWRIIAPRCRLLTSRDGQHFTDAPHGTTLDVTERDGAVSWKIGRAVTDPHSFRVTLNTDVRNYLSRRP